MEKITGGNDFNLVIRAKRRTGTVTEDLSLVGIDDLQIFLTRAGRSKIMMSYALDVNGCAIIYVDKDDVAKGVWGVEMKGTCEGADLRAHKINAFEIVGSMGTNGVLADYVVEVVFAVNVAASDTFVQESIAAHNEDVTAHPSLIEAIGNAGKVDDVMVDGESIVDEDKVAHIDSDKFGKVDDVVVNGESVVYDKVANITIPTKVSDLDNDSDFVTETEAEQMVEDASTEITIGNTTTGEPGTDAAVTNTGTAKDVVLNFTIPQGERGKQGIQGEQGIQGTSAIWNGNAEVLTELEHTTGGATNRTMSQKAISDILLEPVQTSHQFGKIGCYVKVADGAEASGDNYKVSEYISLMGASKISSPDAYVSSQSSSAIASFAFYDDTKTFISGVVGSTANVPNGASYVRISLQKATTKCRILHYGASKQELYNRFLPVGLRNTIADDYIEQICSLSNGYVSVDGTNGSGSAYRRTGYIALDGEYKVGCDNVFSTSSSTVIASFAFYDAEKTLISSVPGNLQYTEVGVPTGARYMKMTTTSAYTTLTLKKYGTSKRDIYSRLPEAGELETLERVINSPIVTSHAPIAKKCYITSTGEESASSGSWRCSPYVELKGEVKLSCNGYTTTSSSSVVMHMAFYDSDKAFISAVSAAGTPSIVDVPSDARYVRMSAKPGDNGEYAYDGTFLLTRYGTSKQDIYDRLDEINMTLGIYDTGLAGKTVAFIGDSITKGTYGVTAGKNYHAVFAQLTGSTDINLGENSAVFVSNPSGGNGSHPRLIDKVTAANLSSADMVVIFAGTNDFSYDSKAIGSHFAEETITPNSRIGNKKRVPPSDTDTFSGAVHELILAIRAIIGEKPIIIMTPLNRGRTSASTYNPNSAECNANGDYLTDFVDALKDIGRFYSIPVFDTGAVFNVDPTKKVGTGQSAYFYDTLHPNDAGHERLAKLLYKFIANNLVV